MKPSPHLIVASSARLFLPIMVLLALSLLATRAPEGIGFAAGLAFAAALVVHALAFGAHASRAAFPPVLLRLALAIGLVLAVIGGGAPRLAAAAQIVEAGLFLVTSASAALIVAVLFARAPTLSDAEW